MRFDRDGINDSTAFRNKRKGSFGIGSKIPYFYLLLPALVRGVEWVARYMFSPNSNFID
jgi:hypothetical protein